MIGGIDIFIETTMPIELGFVDVALAKIIEMSWPNVLLGGEGVDELFFYKDAEWEKVWEEEGGTERASNTMIHVIVNTMGVTMVIDDDQEQEMKLIVERITKYITTQERVWREPAASNKKSK